MLQKNVWSKNKLLKSFINIMFKKQFYNIREFPYHLKIIENIIFKIIKIRKIKQPKGKFDRIILKILKIDVSHRMYLLNSGIGFLNKINIKKNVQSLHI